jgi:thiol-disulfide isomerase/thioredoxin
MDKNAKIFLSIIGLLVLGTLATVVARSSGVTSPSVPGKYDEFATCLKDKGAVFYGAFWCPHCQSQKKLFGTSQKLLPYVECSTPDGNAQVQACTDKNVTSYPTWVFADGSILKGEIPLQDLADKTACVLPQ